jgi:uncharacterized membrane protein YbhN (UPF0104 family)
VTARGRRRLFLGVRIAVLCAVAAGLYFFLRGIDGAALWAALRGARLLPIAGAAALSFVILFLKSCNFRLMLGARVSVWRLFRYTIAAFAGSLLAPARAGEALRLYLLRRRDGVPLTTAGAAAIGEKLVDGLAMVLTVTPAAFLLPAAPPWVARTALALIAAAVAVALVVWILLRRNHGRDGVLGRLATAMQPLRRPRTFALALCFALAGWACDFASILLVLHAVGVSVPPAGPLLILLGVNVALFVPTTPGNIGAHEVGALVALDILGVPREAATAFALLYHGMQVVPLLAVGLADIRLTLGFKAPEPATE